ncbi:alpha/beta hydrolase family esterase [Primorskyibacter sp. S87]|uniref:alpha/beta hydrolase family esterase n=1 Tax=Primorskyibacter sp. S87 TaxID=3415126 RepID=UPI003C7D8CFC
MIRTFVLAVGLSVAAEDALAVCAKEPDPCPLGNGDYHLRLPEGVESPPAVMFLHGAGSSGAAVMRNSALVSGLLERGYAVIAPTGSRQFRQSKGYVWNFYPGWEGRDEPGFLAEVVNDVAQRFGVRSEQVVLGGFSAGGFMVNYLACATPGAFAAYAPVAGGFWRPHPETCAGPVRLLHTHGWADKVVPLEGRFLGGGRYQQGDIFAGLEIWRRANQCPDNRPDNFPGAGEALRREWTGCAKDSALEFVLYPGGHGIPAGWPGMMLDWFEGLPEPN